MDKEKSQECGCEEKSHCNCEGEHEHDNCECGEHGHDGCGCGKEGPLTVDLEDENGNIVPCEIVDGFTYNDAEYALVQNPEDEAVYLFKIVGEGDEGELVIPDDEEFEEVSAYYESLLEKEE